MPPEASPPALVYEQEASLLDDLLEISSRLFHRAVAGKQLALQAKREGATNVARDWYLREFARPGAKKEYLDFIVWQHLQKVRARLKEELHRFMDAALVEQADRDQAIYLHCTPFVDA